MERPSILKGGEAIVARKQIFNEVARDAFAKVGLSVAGEKDGMLHFSGEETRCQVSAQMESSSLTRIILDVYVADHSILAFDVFSLVVKKRVKGEKKAAIMMRPASSHWQRCAWANTKTVTR